MRENLAQVCHFFSALIIFGFFHINNSTGAKILHLFLNISVLYIAVYLHFAVFFNFPWLLLLLPFYIFVLSILIVWIVKLRKATYKAILTIMCIGAFLASVIVIAPLVMLALKLDNILNIPNLAIYLPLILTSGFISLFVFGMSFLIKIKLYQILLILATPSNFTIFLMLLMFHTENGLFQITWAFLPLELFISFLGFSFYASFALTTVCGTISDE